MRRRSGGWTGARSFAHAATTRLSRPLGPSRPVHAEPSGERSGGSFSSPLRPGEEKPVLVSARQFPGQPCAPSGDEDPTETSPASGTAGARKDGSGRRPAVVRSPRSSRHRPPPNRRRARRASNRRHGRGGRPRRHRYPGPPLRHEAIGHPKKLHALKISISVPRTRPLGRRSSPTLSRSFALTKSCYKNILINLICDFLLALGFDQKKRHFSLVRS